MSKKRHSGGNKVRDATGAVSKSDTSAQNQVLGFFLRDGDCLCPPGYRPLSACPEVIMAVNKIASLIGSMTIHLMVNTDGGDVRVKNGLSRKLDIMPNRYMTRMTLMSWIVRTLLLDGAGNAVVFPQTERGYLGDLVPVPADQVSFVPDGGYGYRVMINGRDYDPEEVLHFVLNPDPNYPWLGQGYRIALKDAVGNLAQAAATKKAFMSDKWKPSVVVMVDSNADELATEEGRAELAKKYMQTTETGQPWILPAELMKLETIKPLSLNDLAINESVTLDKRTVASILDVPGFVVGVGAFNRDEWNNFISGKVMSIVRGIEQEMTRTLLTSEDFYIRLNPRSLYSYDISTLAQVADDQYIRGIMTGNEVRDWLGLDPKEGLDELVILENYIPLGAIGDQKKLVGAGDTSDGEGG